MEMATWKMYSKHRHHNETVKQWALEIEKLVRKAHQIVSTSFPDSTRMLIQSFINGLLRQIRISVRLGHHSSFKSALALVLEAEAVL